MLYAKIARECYRSIFIIELVSLQDCRYKNLLRYIRAPMRYSEFYNAASLNPTAVMALRCDITMQLWDYPLHQKHSI